MLDPITEEDLRKLVNLYGVLIWDLHQDKPRCMLMGERVDFSDHRYWYGLNISQFLAMRDLYSDLRYSIWNEIMYIENE